MGNRFFNRNLAGGAMLDIGVYALSFIRWFMAVSYTHLKSNTQPVVSIHDSGLTFNRVDEFYK